MNDIDSAHVVSMKKATPLSSEFALSYFEAYVEEVERVAGAIRASKPSSLTATAYNHDAADYIRNPTDIQD
jgi:hypothetical protein